MPKGPKGAKQPADVIVATVMLARIATGEIDDKPEDDGKDKAARRSARRAARRGRKSSRRSSGARSLGRRRRRGG